MLSAGPNDSSPVDVLIVGGGVAGLAAASTLNRHGIRWTLLEAGDRLGGRVRRGEDGVQLGAEFIHGPSSQFLGAHSRSEFTMENFPNVSDGGALFLDAKGVCIASQEVSEFYAALSRIETCSSAVPSLGDVLAQVTPNERVAQLLGNFIVGLEGVPLHSIPFDRFRREVNTGFQQWTYSDVVGGLDQVVGALTPVGDVRLNHIVRQICSDDSGVNVTSSCGKKFRSRKVVLTVPVGALRSGAIEFSPSPSQEALEWINKIVSVGEIKVALELKGEISSGTRVVVSLGDLPYFWTRSVGGTALLHI